MDPNSSIVTTQESTFLSEWLAANRPNNQLPISAVCNSRCLFCSNDLNPFHIHRGIMRDIEDVKHQLTLMEQRGQELRLSDSLPGRISEGEAFLHPQFFEILEMVRRRFMKNTLCFTTNASLLDEPFLKQLARYRPIEITVSMHSTQPELWARIFSRSIRAAQASIDSLARIRAHGFDLIGAIVPLPAICGWKDIELTYAYFVAHGAKSMILYHPGYSDRTQPKTVCELRCPIDEYMDFVERMKIRHGLPITVGCDMRSPLDIAVRKIIRHTLKGNLKTLGGPYRRVLWLASEAAHVRLDALVAEHAASAANQHQVVVVSNHTYGGNIITAGLLMVEDFVRAGIQTLARWPDTDLILVPSAPFDSLFCDLRGTPAHHIADALGKPVWIVNDAGGYEPLLSPLFVRPGESDIGELEKTMERFNAFLHTPQDADPASLLDMIANWPLDTSTGSLNREPFLSLVADERERLGAHIKPVQQRFERLDHEHTLCIERWQTRDPEVNLNKWIFLVKREKSWRVERLLWGAAND
jgi:NifB/MoaA-like Fe-S oxidoreductase